MKSPGVSAQASAEEASRSANGRSNTKRPLNYDEASSGPTATLQRLAGNRAVASLLQSNGRPLSYRDQQFFGDRLETDLSGVRVHDGPEAAAAADGLEASAFTLGQHIVFGAQTHASEMPDGRTLLGHELAHVAQSARRAVRPTRPLSDGGDAAEREADAVATHPRPVREVTSALIHRKAKPGAGGQNAAPSTADKPPAKDPDPRHDSKFIDNQQVRVAAMLVLADRYELSWQSGRVLVFNRDIDFSGRAKLLPVFDVAPTRDAAVAVAASWQDVAAAEGRDRAYSFYRGPGGVILPTVFSPETAPDTYAGIIKVRDGVLREARAAAELFRGLRNGIGVSIVLGGVLRIVVPRVFSGGGSVPPSVRGEGEFPVSRAPVSEAAPVSRAPVSEAAPISQAPVSEAAPVSQAPISEAAPVSQAPVSEAAQVSQAPVSEAAPVSQAPVSEAAPVSQAPVSEAAPVSQAPVSEAAPVSQAPASEAPASGPATASRADLSRAAGAADREGLTKAGRALQKHGGRAGSKFPSAKGAPPKINADAQKIVDEILQNPASTQTVRHHARFGDIIEIRAPDGRGVRFTSDGTLIGFLEP